MMYAKRFGKLYIFPSNLWDNFNKLKEHQKVSWPERQKNWVHASGLPSVTFLQNPFSLFGGLVISLVTYGYNGLLIYAKRQ